MSEKFQFAFTHTPNKIGCLHLHFCLPACFVHTLLYLYVTSISNPSANCKPLHWMLFYQVQFIFNCWIWWVWGDTSTHFKLRYLCNLCENMRYCFVIMFSFIHQSEVKIRFAINLLDNLRSHLSKALKGFIGHGPTHYGIHTIAVIFADDDIEKASCTMSKWLVFVNGIFIQIFLLSDFLWNEII